MSDRDECVFCRKIDNRGDEHGYAIPMLNGEVWTFEPIDPVTPGHRLFVPTEHVENDARCIDLALPQAMRAAEAWAVANGVGSWNLITSAGAAATQTVAHLHVHLVPRREGDGLALPWTQTAPIRVVPGMGEDMAHLLSNAGGGTRG